MNKNKIFIYNMSNITKSNITLVNEKNETISEFFKYQGLNFKYVKDSSGEWKKGK